MHAFGKVPRGFSHVTHWPTFRETGEKWKMRQLEFHESDTTLKRTRKKAVGGASNTWT